MKKILKKYKLIIVAVILYALCFFFRYDLFLDAIDISWGFLLEMLQVLPPVMIISALITVWVPTHIIEKHLGSKAGIKGIIISILIGAVSAGPIYAAFPAALVLLKKKASISNIVIILSSWAVIKIPMLFVEANFLGPKFTLVRLIFTVPAIILIGLVTGLVVKRKDITSTIDKGYNSVSDVYEILPKVNCAGCGYKSCKDFATAVYAKQVPLSSCIILNKEA